MPLSAPNSGPLNNPPPALRLHQIHSNMPFGHTNYVPEEETRNLRANFPEPDILQPFKELATSDTRREESFDVTEPILFNKDLTAEYCHDVSTRSLSHPDYRKLAWRNNQGDYDESVDFTKRAKVKKVASPASVHTGDKKSTEPSEIATSKLESRYRLGNAIPFCLNPQAAYLIQHATIIGQQKKVARELGTSIIYLNDRNHFRTLEHRLKARWERKGDLAHKIRANIEYHKSRTSSRDMVPDLLPAIQTDRPGAESKQLKRGKISTDNFPEFQPDLSSPETSVPVQKVERSGGPAPSSEHDTSTVENAITPGDLPAKDSGLTGTEHSESVLPSVDSTGGILSSRMSIRSLYDKAERSVKVKQEINRRYLKYKDLSWDRNR